MKFIDKINPFHYIFSKQESTLIMGATFEKQGDKQTETREIGNEYKKADTEKYFRPSCRSILNDQKLDYKFFQPYYEKALDNIILPASLMNSPENTLVNYFSIIREAENLTGHQVGGCGTVGMAKIPFPIAYHFFTKDYQKKVPYTAYLMSFKGIGHTNLIKLNKLSVQNQSKTTRYFIELETIEGSPKDLTYFAYYYGYVTIKNENNMYKIEEVTLIGEDFLCAAYHLWQHNAEAVVDSEYGNWCKLIKKRWPTKQEGYVKNIDSVGTDGSEYRFVFYQLTNDSDILIAQYKKNSKGKWDLIKIDPEKCLKENK
ncbi:hypothetical protein ACIGC1_19600 [Peribacillus butanolivorans]|uniref:hypothetical protein n=1 Tax=Peribacillus butanolivorans TaxID=421767 RepID=UPI0037C8CF12